MTMTFFPKISFMIRIIMTVYPVIDSMIRMIMTMCILRSVLWSRWPRLHVSWDQFCN